MNRLDNKKNKAYNVIQSNRLIEAAYRLTLQEKRLILILISVIDKNDSDFKTYRLKAAEIANFLNIRRDSYYAELQKITKNLLTKALTINEPDGALYVNWFSAAKYKNNEGYVEFDFSPRLKPYLLLLQKEFTRYSIKKIIQLKSLYSMRIYELLKQYENTEHKTRVIQIDDLRKKLGLIELDGKKIIRTKFARYGDLKKNILKPAQAELHKIGFFFQFTEQKNSRKVDRIKFIFQKDDIKIKEKKLPFLFPEDEREKKYKFNKLKVEMAVDEIIKATGDKKSKEFYYKVAWAFILADKEHDLMQALSEFKADMSHARNKGAAFTQIVTRIAKTANIDIYKKT
ncbi:MAG: replication initiation protein [Deltaproteobacteria bacterium]|nr:replication initiation protein [Deltaproteobacteria bacterium]